MCSPRELTVAMMMPARMTPRETAPVVDFQPMFSKDAARVPVHAPVPGRGMPTKSSRAINRPLRLAVATYFCPAFSPFCRILAKRFPIMGLVLPQRSTFRANR